MLLVVDINPSASRPHLFESAGSKGRRLHSSRLNKSVDGSVPRLGDAELQSEFLVPRTAQAWIELGSNRLPIRFRVLQTQLKFAPVGRRKYGHQQCNRFLIGRIQRLIHNPARVLEMDGSLCQFI